MGVDDVGAEEQISIWIERRPGAVWAVGRVVNPQLRESDDPRPEDVIFEGYELGDALDRANEALEDDVSVLEGDGLPANARPFTRKEVLPVVGALVLQPLTPLAGSGSRRAKPGSASLTLLAAGCVALFAGPYPMCCPRSSCSPPLRATPERRPWSTRIGSSLRLVLAGARVRRC